MNTFEIIDFVNLFSKNKIFRGVFACDDLPQQIKLPSAFVINLSSKSESGSHWVALYINEKGAGYYFDSFGFPPKNKHILYFIGKFTKNIQYNKIQLQHITSNKCGKFCCAFIYTVISHKPIKNFISKFSTNHYINEIIIENVCRYLRIKS